MSRQTLRLKADLITCLYCNGSGRNKTGRGTCHECRGNGFIIHDRSEFAPVEKK